MKEVSLCVSAVIEHRYLEPDVVVIDQPVRVIYRFMRERDCTPYEGLTVVAEPGLYEVGSEYLVSWDSEPQTRTVTETIERLTNVEPVAEGVAHGAA